MDDNNSLLFGQTIGHWSTGGAVVVGITFTLVVSVVVVVSSDVQGHG